MKNGTQSRMVLVEGPIVGKDQCAKYHVGANDMKADDRGTLILTRTNLQEGEERVAMFAPGHWRSAQRVENDGPPGTRN